MRIITAREGYVYRRIHDGFIMGKIIYLGIDYSTGEPREDKAEYYKEIKDESIQNISNMKAKLVNKKLV